LHVDVTHQAEQANGGDVWGSHEDEKAVLVMSVFKQRQV
jgi:hypothetical protein